MLLPLTGTSRLRHSSLGQVFTLLADPSKTFILALKTMPMPAHSPVAPQFPEVHFDTMSITPSRTQSSQSRKGSDSFPLSSLPPLLPDVVLVRHRASTFSLELTNASGRPPT